MKLRLKIKICLIVSIILVSIQINAQASYLESYEKAIVFEDLNQFDSAAVYFQLAYNMINDSLDWERKVTCLNKSANSFRKSGDYPKAFSAYTLALSEDRPDRDHLLFATTYIGLGVVFHIKNNYEKAQSYYNQSLSIRINKLEENDLLIADCYNNLGVLSLNFGKLSEAEQYLKKSLNIRIYKLGENHVKVAQNYSNLANVFDESGKYLLALDYYQQSLNIFLKNPKNELQSSTPYNNIGIIYNEIGQYEKSITYIEKGLNIRLKYYKSNHRLIAESYNNLANVFRNTGDYKKAHDYFDRSYDIQIEKFGETHRSISQIYTNKSIVYLDQKVYKKALHYSLKALGINKVIFGKNHFILAINYINIGNAYKGLGELSKALDYYQNSLALRLEHFDDNHPLIASNYNNIADVYKIQGKYSEAIIFYQKALSILEYNFGKNTPKAGPIYNNWSDLYYREKKWKQSLEYLQKAIACVVQNVNPKNVQEKPNLEIILDRKNLLFFLETKASALNELYKENRNLSDLQLSLETDLVNIKLIEQALSSFKNLETKLFLRTEVDVVFERAIHSALELHHKSPNSKYIETIHLVLEKSKAFQLLEHLNQVKARHFANVPDSLIQKEQKLRGVLTYYNKSSWLARLDTIQLNKQIDRAADEMLKDSLMIIRQKKVDEINRYATYSFESQREINDILNRLEEGYPQYYKLKYDFEVPTIESIQQTIFQSQLYGEKAAIIEFYVGEQNIFIKAITKDTIFFHQLDRPGNFNQVVAQFRSSLTNENFLKDKTIVEGYSKSATTLYDLLLKNILEKINDKTNKLIIIPDGILHHVQFDLLLTQEIDVDNYENPDCSNFNYLLNSFTTSQVHSLRLLLNTIHQQKINKKTGESFVFCGIEPEYGKRNINNLRTNADRLLLEFVKGNIHNLSEVDQFASLFKGKNLILKKERATESIFISTIQEYSFKILHISSHGLVNDQFPEYSKLVLTFTNFEDPNLDDCIEVAELYNMVIPAELVVLSACNTGYGANIYSGEGVISIARGVAFAGCPSIVMSMWELEGQSNIILMTDFYKNLLNGMPTDEALRAAKLSYLHNEDRGLEEITPFRWAATTSIGLMVPVFNP